MNFNRILKKKKNISFFLQTKQEIPSFSSGDAIKKPFKRIFFLNFVLKQTKLEKISKISYAKSINETDKSFIEMKSKEN